MRTSRKKLAALTSALAVVLGVAPAALAQEVSPIKINSPRATGAWKGSITTGATMDPAACTTTTCDIVPVDVRLPRHQRRGRGMLVAITWSKDKWLEPGYDLNLYVYAPDGRLAGKSESLVDSHAESVWVQRPVNGRYTVKVVPHNVADKEPLQYRGFVNTARGRTIKMTATALGESQSLTYVGSGPARPRRSMLPDLVPGKPANFHIATGLAASFYVGAYHGVEHQPSCYPQEMTGADEDQPSPSDRHPTRCLRFDSQLINLGDGPYEIRVFPDDNDPHAYQVIYDSSGGYRERPVGQSYFSNAHGHFHYTGFEETGLYTVRPDGMPGRLVSRLPDKGRCATDTGNPLFGRAGGGPPRYQFPRTCDTNDNTDPRDPKHPGSRYFRNGISPGWDDTYSWWILDQYIDISNVRDGRYLVVYRVNTLGHLRESTTADNVSVACVAFHDTHVRTCRVPRAAARLGRGSVEALRSHHRLGSG